MSGVCVDARHVHGFQATCLDERAPVTERDASGGPAHHGCRRICSLHSSVERYKDLRDVVRGGTIGEVGFVPRLPDVHGALEVGDHFFDAALPLSGVHHCQGGRAALAELHLEGYAALRRLVGRIGEGAVVAAEREGCVGAACSQGLPLHAGPLEPSAQNIGQGHPACRRGTAEVRSRRKGSQVETVIRCRDREGELGGGHCDPLSDQRRPEPVRAGWKARAEGKGRPVRPDREVAECDVAG